MRTSLLFVLPLFAACGIPNGAVVADLDADQLDTLCNELAVDEPREITCEFGKGVTVTVTSGFTVEDCGDSANVPEGCPATAGDLRDCIGALNTATDEEVCDPKGETPPECDALFVEACVTNGAG